MLSTIRRLRTWDFRTQVRTSADRNLRLAFTELDTLKDKLGLSEPIIERTAYRKAQGKGMLRGRSILAVLAAAIYIACRELDAPRTLDDIATISNIKRKSIAKYERANISTQYLTSNHRYHKMHRKSCKQSQHKRENQTPSHSPYEQCG